MVRLAQQASARVIAVDEFPREKVEDSAAPAIKTGTDTITKTGNDDQD